MFELPKDYSDLVGQRIVVPQTKRRVIRPSGDTYAAPQPLQTYWIKALPIVFSSDPRRSSGVLGGAETSMSRRGFAE